MTRTVSLASYIFRRLQQHGVNHCFGVPGDFTLRALDHVKNAGVKWLGNCNELNAGYAADGYARINGLGVLFTTYGVGELSAINAVAGSTAEGVPVVHVVGYPKLKDLKGDRLIHHALGTQQSNTRLFENLYEKVANSICAVQSEQAVDHLDESISQSVQFGSTTYINLPSDIIDSEVDAERLEEPLKFTRTDPRAIGQTVSEIASLLRSAKAPLLLVDSKGFHRTEVRSAINEFVKVSRIPTLTMPSGAGVIDHTHENYYGVHSGPVGQIDTSEYVKQADVLLAFGCMFSDTQTLGWSTVPTTKNTIHISSSSVTLPHTPKTPFTLDLPAYLPHLQQALQPGLPPNPTAQSLLSNFRTVKPSPITNLDSPIDQTSLYLRLNTYLRPYDILLLGNATPILGGRDFVLPSPTCRTIVSGQWFSIGSMVPAAFGAAVAQQQSPFPRPQGRTILFDGDGSFQVTAQELSTIIHHRLNLTIFIINNAGYAYERLIHNPDADYHDIAPWDYLALPAAFGAATAIKNAQAVGEEYSVDTFRMRTWRDLEAFLDDERFDNGFGGRAKRGLKLVEVMVDKMDVPEKFKEVFAAAGRGLGGGTG